LIIDTGILVALADRDDRHHREARAIFALPDLKVVPEPVVVESDWMILSSLGVDAEIAFLQGLAEGALVVEAPRDGDRSRAAELVAQYRDLEIGYVDAISAAIAERTRDLRIATLDRRHFLAIRPRTAPSFELLP
jgi:predicted nucleic acid-binding protein